MCVCKSAENSITYWATRRYADFPPQYGCVAPGCCPDVQIYTATRFEAICTGGRRFMPLARLHLSAPWHLFGRKGWMPSPHSACQCRLQLALDGQLVKIVRHL